MYVSVSRLRVRPECATDLIEAFRARAHLVDNFDGFQDLEVWQASSDPEEILMVSHWRDRAAFTSYVKSAEHRVSHDRIGSDLEEAIVLERLEHLTGYEVVGR
ncbi:MAG: antibiotic biosynthesis monooxygenase family protein [Tepidiformaceae bacterium]